MHIILLSGGSGKRLWPISNDVYSKQFIKVFKNANGEYESMFQRVYSQIKSIDPEIQITIATSSMQVSAIRNQLGQNVSICVEPCRRDTCPAILLAANYLHDELHIGPDETIVVCPIDPYVDNSYYKFILSLDKYVQESNINLTLMGVEPTVPSDKYGYIIPEKSSKLSKVIEFKEKPDVDSAKAYINSGALWNAGVFAFKLGYILKVAHEIVDFVDYKDLFIQYESLKKMSFDYAVVEKEPSIQVVRYVGEWKDVGTWNILTEVMDNNTKGNVTLDNTCSNTHVINNLEVPILCMGCHDMVIAASNDGILVSDKQRSGAIKSYVEKISTEIRYAEKSWGIYKVIDIQPGSLTLKVNMYAGRSMSYHCHDFRDEVWTLITGEGIATVDGMEQIVKAGDVVTIAAGCKHTIKALKDMQIIEIQIGDIIREDDKEIFDGTDAS